jgi:hypothetical protein
MNYQDALEFLVFLMIRFLAITTTPREINPSRVIAANALGVD